MEHEIWLTIPEYDKYGVSNLGRIKIFNYRGLNRERIMNPYKRKDGYINVLLWKNIDGLNVSKLCKVSRIVASAFLEKQDGKIYINHKDGNRSNNRIENLEWVTQRENVTHSYRKTMQIKKLTGAFEKKVKGVPTGKWAACIRVNNKLKHLGYFETQQGAHERYLQELSTLGLVNSYA